MKLAVSIPSLVAAFTIPDVKQLFDYDALAANFRSISEKQARGEIDAATFQSLKDVIFRLSTTVKEALEDDEERAQGVYDQSKADVEACDTTRCSDFKSKVAPKTKKADGDKTAFDTCKDEEQTEYDNMTNHCGIVNNLVNSWNPGNPVITHEHCTGVDFKSGDSDAVATYMNCICDFVDKHKQDYYDKRDNCTWATEDHGDKDKECEDKQGDMDSSFCAEQAEIQSVCSSYHSCRDTEEQEHGNTKKMVQGWEEQMRAQRVALEQLICWGNHILDNNTDLTGCNDLDHADCTKYSDCPTIKYPDYSPRVKCNEPSKARLPCESEYNSAVCGEYSTGDVKCHACTPCATTAPFGFYEASADDNSANCPSCVQVDDLVGASPALYTPSGHGTFGKWDAGSKSCAILASTHTNPALTASTAANSVNDGFCCDALYGFMVANLARGMKDRKVNGLSNPGSDWVRVINRSDGGLPIQECSIDSYWGSCSTDPELENAADDAAMEKLRAYLCKNAATCNYATTQAGGWIADGRLPAVTIPAAGEWAALMQCDTVDTCA